MRILVLGHRGMLGHVIARYLTEQGFEVLSLARRFIVEEAEDFATEIRSLQPSWCVNCIVVGPRQATSRKQLWEVNSLLPQICSLALPFEVGFIQPSSDAVFNPVTANRKFNELPDPADDYGWSKQLAELSVRGPNCHVVRCSLVGPELGAGRHLLAWFLAQTEPVPGYINQLWNGITSLEFAKLVLGIIREEIPPGQSLQQPGTWPPASKYAVLTMIGRVWQHPTPVIPTEAPVAVMRSLIPSVECPPLSQQLSELKAWY